MTESANLIDCIISYHLCTGQVLSEPFKQDLPAELWEEIKREYADCESAIDVQIGEVSVLLPKSNISYITMHFR